jgi:hypothetical protein
MVVQTSEHRASCVRDIASSPEFTPVGALEEDIFADLARLTWRKQNLQTFRIAEPGKKRQQTIEYESVPGVPSQARTRELGDVH